MKLMILTNGIYAIPVIQKLKSNVAIDAVGVTDEYHEGIMQVEVACRQLQVPVCRIKNNPQHLQQVITEMGIDLVITCGFPWKIDSSILGMEGVDFLNIHLARLPEYRGPNPVFWEIKNREEKGAACIHALVDEMDQGPILSMKPVPISPFDTHGLHLIQAAVKAAEMIQSLLLELKSGNWRHRLKDQPFDTAKYYPRPTAEDLVIRWDTMSAKDVVALVKACNPWNKGAFTACNGMRLRVADARLVPHAGEEFNEAGVVVKADVDDGIWVRCMDGEVIKLEVVTLEEGFFYSGALTQIGISVGTRFDSSILLQAAGVN